jgi:undecaprenyl-diphosphatase
MSLIDSIFFGALQGATEFLPISSSGHLILLANFFQVDLPTIVFEVVVHLGTLISILFIFRSDIISIINKAKIKGDFQEIILISSATIPIAMTGLIFKSNIETAFRSVAIVGVCMVITGIILGSTLFTSFIRKKNISLVSALIIGIMQAFALLPGISRSGITISTALWIGISKEEAGRFSFLIAIPAIIGSLILTLPDIINVISVEGSLLILIATLVSAFIIGLIALKILIRVLESGRLYLFSGYCIFVGVITLILTI